MATANSFCCNASWFCATAIADEADCESLRRLEVDGGAIEGWISMLLLRVVAPSDELRLDLRTGENGTVRCVTGGLVVGGSGTARGGPAGI